MWGVTATVVLMVGASVVADKPPAGPQLHHFTGQEGYDTFGSAVAPQPVYGSTGRGYGGGGGGGGYPPPQYTSYHTQLVPVAIPTYEGGGGGGGKGGKGGKGGGSYNPFYQLDQMIKGVGDKFSKFVKNAFKTDKLFKKYQKKGGSAEYYYEPYPPVYRGSYGPPPKAYAPPPKAYGPPPKVYGAPPPTYGPPPPLYGPPPSLYH